MNIRYGLSEASIDRIKEIPWEASIFFIGWIWLGGSVFGMNLVNIYLTQSISDIYRLIVGIVYLLPMFAVVLTVFNNRNIAGMPLIICSGIIGFLAIISHSKFNSGVEIGFYVFKEIASMVPTIMLVAMPISFYIYARSIGYGNTRNQKMILIYSTINGLLIAYNELIGAGLNSEIIVFLMLSFLLVIGPILGGLAIWDVISKSA